MKGAKVNPGSHDNRIEVIDVSEGFGFSLAHLCKFLLAGGGSLVEVEPLTLVTIYAFLEDSVLFALKIGFFCIVLKTQLWSPEGVFILAIVSILFREFGPLLLAFTFILFLLFAESFLFCISFLLFRFLLATFFVLFLCFTLFAGGEFSGVDLSFFDLKREKA